MTDNEIKRVGFNINNHVYVALTDLSKATYYDRAHEFNKQFIAKGINTRIPTQMAEDEYGFSKLQLWSFMDFYSKEWAMTNLPTLDGKIYFNKSDLSPLDLKEGENK